MKHPGQFFSTERTAHIEPEAFVTHVLAYRGLEPASIGVRQTVLLCFIPELERRVLRALNSPSPHPTPIQRQTLYNPEGLPFSLIASPMGASMAVMLLEQLIALGARHFLYLGFCGALEQTYRIGDCFLPLQAIREEGTSYHYLPADVIPQASPRLTTPLTKEARARRSVVHSGTIWTTDAPYRETAQKIRYFQEHGVHAVDMEIAALFAVAAYRQCDVAALLVVSDECYHPVWKPGFGAERLRKGCREAVALGLATVMSLASDLATENLRE